MVETEKKTVNLVSLSLPRCLHGFVVTGRVQGQVILIIWHHDSADWRHLHAGAITDPYLINRRSHTEHTRPGAICCRGNERLLSFLTSLCLTYNYSLIVFAKILTTNDIFPTIGLNIQ